MKKMAGFMLIELAVASLVIAVGILALLGLSNIGERAATDTENETRAALFADEVFTTLRLYSDQVSQHTNHLGWLEFWTAVATGERILPLAPYNDRVTQRFGWDAPDDDIPPPSDAPTDPSEIQTILWTQPSADGTASFPDYAFQYRLSIASRSAETTDKDLKVLDGAEFSSSYSTNEPINVVWVTLHVWNGRFRSQVEPFTFYTHFADPGGLP